MRAAEDQTRALKFYDMDMRDARNAADSLGQAFRTGEDQDYLRDLKILGIAIGCYGSPKWADIVLNGCDAVWNTTGSMIANTLGLPILVRSTHSIHDRPGDRKWGNEEVSLLYRDIDSKFVLPGLQINSRQLQPLIYGDLDNENYWIRKGFVGVSGFGSSLAKFSAGIGTCYAVRADGKPLPKEHVEVLCQYIADEVQPELYADSDVPANVKVTERDDILNTITRESFSKHFNNNFKESKIKQGDLAWQKLPSPYDIKEEDVQDCAFSEAFFSLRDSAKEVSLPRASPCPAPASAHARVAIARLSRLLPQGNNG
jgi:hypothetical protein